MKSEFRTSTKLYYLKTDPFICNKFGLAEFFAVYADKLGCAKQHDVLDVGCGAGPIGIFLADQYGCRVTGVELNPLASRCCVENIEALSLGQSFEVCTYDFSRFDSLKPARNWDLIVSNPPIDENVSPETIQRFAQDDYSRILPELYSYVTNSWHNTDGEDLLDLIFAYAASHLRPFGRVMVVFCALSCPSTEIVIRKAETYCFAPEQYFSGNITPESIGVENFTQKVIETHIISFSKKS
jgi:cyclopropane fatty-acyl-phospholipid synthase-like methyltransferase